MEEVEGKEKGKTGTIKKETLFSFTKALYLANDSLETHSFYFFFFFNNNDNSSKILLLSFPCQSFTNFHDWRWKREFIHSLNKVLSTCYLPNCSGHRG